MYVSTETFGTIIRAHLIPNLLMLEWSFPIRKQFVFNLVMMTHLFLMLQMG